MSIQTKYACPRCKATLSDYSKKGFSIIHTDVGIPVISCLNCKGLIKTGHKPYSKMDRGERTGEVIKMTINVLMNALLFGFLIIGGIAGMIVNTVFFETDEFLNFPVMIISSLLIAVIRINTYRRWIKFCDSYAIENGYSIEADKYNQHPDW